MQRSLAQRFKDRRNRELVKHYVEHGDQNCAKCAQGFNIYWLANRDK